MARTYKALALLLSYPEEAYRALYPAALQAIECAACTFPLAGEVVAKRPEGGRADKQAPVCLRAPHPPTPSPQGGGGEPRLSHKTARALARLADELTNADMLDLQARYVQLFDRSRHLSLHLYEHVHGESRDRGQAMVELNRLYATRGALLSARELPDHLPVFLEFLSVLEPREAAALLGEAAHVITAVRDRLKKRRSPYAAVFAALVELADTNADPAALQALLAEPEDDPNDLAALDRAWAEEPVNFGPDQSGGCPQAREMLGRMGESGA